ncbi:MAG: glucose PTS transporter subunit IIA, partial [Clostridium perfringens]|nr:glucose PTS transporter subunit IIA [Clostridium perfringens]
PIGINNRMTMGYDSIIYPGMLASNISQGGACLAVAFKSKKADIKQLASSAGITAVCGITEPALYGVNLRFKTPLYASMIGGAIGGLFLGIFKVVNYSGGSPGFLTLPSYIGGDSMSNFVYACIGAVISLVVSFVVCMIIYKDVKEDLDNGLKIKEININNDSKKGQKVSTLCSPASGKVVSLKEVNDPTFSEEIMGKGIAIIPNEGKIVSPVNGTVSMVFNTKHAIGILGENGEEILIHIGLDTVKLGGKYFKSYVKQGDKVKVGTLLVEFNINAVKKEGYDCITPIIITNSAEYENILPITNKSINLGEKIIEAVK